MDSLSKLKNRLAYPDPDKVCKTEDELYSSLLAVAFQSPTKMLSSKRRRSLKRRLTPEIRTHFSSGSKLTYTDSLNLGYCNVISRYSPTCKVSLHRAFRAKSLPDDFYLNLLDWGEKGIAVGLAHSVFIMNPDTGLTTDFTFRNQSEITCVKWSQDGLSLFVSLEDGQVLRFDPEKNKEIASIKREELKFSTLVNYSQDIVTSAASNDILQIDFRNCFVEAKMSEHDQDVCGLAWNWSKIVLASGSNDNSVFLWDSRKFKLLKQLGRHRSAVKAMDWNPLKGTELVTGGGYKDKCIRVWDTQGMACSQTISTDSQITGIRFVKEANIMVSTHGFSDHTVKIWDSKAKTSIDELVGHDERVNYLSFSPKQDKFVTGGSDEALKIWKVEKPKIQSICKKLEF